MFLYNHVLFLTFILTVKEELQKNFLTNKTYVLWKISVMTETDVADSYEISWHVYINMLFIYLACAFESKLKLILTPRTIFSN